MDEFDMRSKPAPIITVASNLRRILQTEVQRNSIVNLCVQAANWAEFSTSPIFSHNVAFHRRFSVEVGAAASSYVREL
jgi:hypothetical protein